MVRYDEIHVKSVTLKYVLDNSCILAILSSQLLSLVTYLEKVNDGENSYYF